MLCAHWRERCAAMPCHAADAMPPLLLPLERLRHLMLLIIDADMLTLIFSPPC